MTIMLFDAVYFEPESRTYPLGAMLYEKYSMLPWIPIENHNRIEEMQKKANSEFPKMKRNLIVGIRKTHKYVENHKISDFLVPWTSSGCTAMCLYCYLVCNYNKCAYLRLFVNREQMLERLIKASLKYQIPQTFEIGSNSDLVLENTITGNLEWSIEEFGARGHGKITLPTKFDTVERLLPLKHYGKTIFRMSVNPPAIITKAEFGTSRLEGRIRAVNDMCEAGYPTGILIAPVILTEGYQKEYGELIDMLAQGLSDKAKRQLTIEIIFMTYSYVHRAINGDAFPNALELYNSEQMVGRGRGKYCYRPVPREEGELFLKEQLQKKLSEAKIVYIC